MTQLTNHRTVWRSRDSPTNQRPLLTQGPRYCWSCSQRIELTSDRRVPLVSADTKRREKREEGSRYEEHICLLLVVALTMARYYFGKCFPNCSIYASFLFSKIWPIACLFLPSPNDMVFKEYLSMTLDNFISRYDKLRPSFLLRRLRDSLQGEGPSERQDRGHQEGEARPHRGRCAHVCPQGDLIAQTARKIKSPKYCQVRQEFVNLFFLCVQNSASLHKSHVSSCLFSCLNKVQSLLSPGRAPLIVTE